MSTAGAVGREPPLHWFQRMLDSITFLVLLGVLFPTGLYTVWSVLELRELPHFSEAPAGALHASGASGHGATSAARAPVSPSAAPAADGVRVAMRSMAFQTKVLEITAGTSVTWVNEDPFDHAVAYGRPDLPAEERLFEGSGDFGQGGTFTQRFDEPGEHPIYCSTPGHFAAGMTMTVVVAEAQP
jgi:plastocyanin